MKLRLKTPKPRIIISEIMHAIDNGDKSVTAKIEHYEIIAAYSAVFVKNTANKKNPIYMLTFDTCRYLFLNGDTIEAPLASKEDKERVKPLFATQKKRRY